MNKFYEKELIYIKSIRPSISDFKIAQYKFSISGFKIPLVIAQYKSRRFNDAIMFGALDTPKDYFEIIYELRMRDSI